MRCITILAMVFAVSGPALAETAYVTDNLRLGMHQAADTSDRAFRTLESGQEFEILDRDRNYAHVRLPDGAEGYVKTAYLVFEKPARLIVAETQAEVERLEQELSEIKSAFAAPGATISALEAELTETQAKLEIAQKSLEEQSAENSKYKSRYDQFKMSLPITWVAGAMAVCLLAGFLSGLWWVDSRNRKRHGGVRVH